MPHMEMSLQLVFATAVMRLGRSQRHLPGSHTRTLSTMYNGLELTCEPDILGMVERLTSLASDMTNTHPPAGG